MLVVSVLVLVLASQLLVLVLVLITAVLVSTVHLLTACHSCDSTDMESNDFFIQRS